jgi:hypothetical protein
MVKKLKAENIAVVFNFSKTLECEKNDKELA